MKAWVMPEAAAPTMTSLPSPRRRFTASVAVSGLVPESAMVRVMFPPAALISATASLTASTMGMPRGPSAPVSGSTAPSFRGTASKSIAGASVAAACVAAAAAASGVDGVGSASSSSPQAATRNAASRANRGTSAK